MGRSEQLGRHGWQTKSTEMHWALIELDFFASCRWTRPTGAPSKRPSSAMASLRRSRSDGPQLEALVFPLSDFLLFFFFFFVSTIFQVFHPTIIFSVWATIQSHRKRWASSLPHCFRFLWSANDSTVLLEFERFNQLEIQNDHKYEYTPRFTPLEVDHTIKANVISKNFFGFLRKL